MSYSDDHASPAAPFSGDNTGEIFDAPDMVLQSPTTNERVVDTQSGFLVVVKRLEDRLALLVRRRIGTPPSSSILLTPDESVKLSRILSTTTPEDSGRKGQGADEPETAEAWAGEPGQLSIGRSVVGHYSPASLLYDAGEERGLVALKGSYLALAGAACFVLLIGGLIGYAVEHAKRPPAAKPTLPVAFVDPLAENKVDGFARRYVTNMLDFDPDSYRVSQIRAMAAMAPKLVDSYWKDTGFPIGKSKLSQFPQGVTVMVTKIAQDRKDKLVAVDVYAEMVNPATKLGAPVHLKLAVSVDSDGELRVLEQKDLSNAPASKE